MAQPAVPRIFSPARRLARQMRALARQRRGGATGWLIEAMERDCIERIAFMRLEPRRALVLATAAVELPRALAGMGAGKRAQVALSSALEEERPLADHGHDLIVSLARLDTVNDLPGALIHLRHGLGEGGLMIAQMTGAGSLPVLRRIMLAADGERPAARLHPQIDSRAATALLDRAGFTRQVVDTHLLKASYRSFDRLIADLRDQGLTNALADPAPPLGKAALARAQAAFDELRDAEGRVTESFEIVTLTGWR